MPEHTAQKLDGKYVSDIIVRRVAGRVAKLSAPVTLVTVLAGSYEPSRLYVGRKMKIAKQAGIQSRTLELPDDITQEKLEGEVKRLAGDKSVHGILIQLPLPEHIDAVSVIDLLPMEKDVDGLTRSNLGALVRGEEGHVPCTPLGVMHILDHYNIETKARQVVVLGRSYLVGLPMSLLLARKGVDATVTLCHSRTADLPGVCRQADILVAAVGVAKMVDKSYIKPGAAVIDVGVSYTEEGVSGDVDYDAVAAVAGAITPMPGGTGPMTVASLIENTLHAALMQGVR